MDFEIKGRVLVGVDFVYCIMKHISPIECMVRRGNFRYLESLRILARVNRKNPTKSELLIWNQILKNRKTGYLFLRQKPIGKFIVDFYCSKLLLVIEIDGDSHDRRQNYDKSRDVYFEQRKILTIRYKNEDVLNDLENIEIDLKKIINTRKKILFPLL